jgi:hypothetical protein
MYDVFLSHAHDDAQLVEQLANHLTDQVRLNVWLDKWILVPGDKWQQELARGLNEARCCVVCLSAQTPKGWFREEIESALNRQAQDHSFRVIPLLLPGAQEETINEFLQLRTWVDLRQGVHDHQNLRLLIAGIRGVAPGRPPQVQNNNGEQEVIRLKLLELRQLRSEQLVDEDVAQEFQRKLLTIHFLGQEQ